MWSFIIFTPMAVMGVILAPGLAGIFGLPPDATAMTASYLSVSLGAVPVLAMLMMSSGVLRGAGDARTPMYVTIGANVVNMTLA
ncbi:MATE family efflux transporter, partial [Klebsiella pneumoniae]